MMQWKSPIDITIYGQVHIILFLYSLNEIYKDRLETSKAEVGSL